jgi:hypothetical protein
LRMVFEKKTWPNIYTQIWQRTPFVIDSVLRYFADNKKRGRPMFPNVRHQIIHVKLAGITRSKPYFPR